MNTRKYIDNLGGKLNTVGNNIKIAREKNNLSRRDKIKTIGILQYFGK